ncbi:MAG: hypothetical protein R2784_04365 [Saprospiraceae bacterium]
MRNNLGNHQRSVITAFLEHRFTLLKNKLDITPGVSFNYYSDFGSNFLPGIDVGVDVWNGLKAYGNAGLTYRIPTTQTFIIPARSNWEILTCCLKKPLPMKPD